MPNSSKITTLAKRLKTNPNDSFSKFAFALELLKIDKRQSAIILFEDIVKNDPNYTGVYYHLGEQYVLDGENKKALNIYKTGIKIASSQNDDHAKTELSTALSTLELEVED